jgi:putative aminopeptidase FrvX
VQALFPDAARDRAGNVVIDRGTGPAVLIACPFDEVGYVVGGIRDDGWLTLRRVGARAPNAIWDQSHEGQRVTLWGRNGALPAVVGVRSTHLQRGRSASDVPFSVDDAVVDIGASTAAQAKAAGAELLSPVARAKVVTRYGDPRLAGSSSLLAGPNSGRRSACAALAAAAWAHPGSGHVIIAFLVEQELGQRGLRTIANATAPITRTILIDGGAIAPGAPQERPDTVLARAIPLLGAVERWTVPVRHLGTAVETVKIDELPGLTAMLMHVIGEGR